MRVLQLIDSLEAGGAERMAVNLANASMDAGVGVVLVASRTGGILESQINRAVPYYCLRKKRTLDLKAFRRLMSVIKTHQITIIHAHSSSFFMAYVFKIMQPHLQLIWHDHYGNSEHLEQRSFKILKYCSNKFDVIIAVNQKLADWSISVLKHSRVAILTNFVIPSLNQHPKTALKGTAGKRVVCLANLRPQKDHITLINAFKEVVNVCPEWSLHLIGKDFKDDYSASLYEMITELQLEKQVFCYGSCEDISFILSQTNIGVLSSESEGLPLALLEYGQHVLPVIATAVGDIPKILTHQEHGLLVPAKNEQALSQALQELIANPNTAQDYARNLSLQVELNFSSKAAINRMVDLYKSLEHA